jgi:hypothetical protein
MPERRRKVERQLLNFIKKALEKQRLRGEWAFRGRQSQNGPNVTAQKELLA